MRLIDAKIGASVVIVGVDGEGELKSRLLALGFTRGTVAAVTGFSPFKASGLVDIRGCRIALKCAVLRTITVKYV